MPVHSFGVRGLGVLGEIDAGLLVLGADPKADHAVGQLGQHK
jgi:hypothetical protein